MDGAVLVGRLLLASIFLFSGLNKLMDPAMTAQMIASKGLPAPELIAYLAGALEIAGGLAVATGFMARLGAIGLAAFTLLAGIMFHDFWNMTGPDAQMQMQAFMKNIAITGGFLVLAAYGPGRYAIGHGHTVKAQPGNLGIA